MSKRVSFREPLYQSTRQSSPRTSIRRSSPRQPLSTRRSSPRQPLSTRKSSPRRGNVSVQQSSRLTFEFTSNIYDLTNIERLLTENNIPFFGNENSIKIDLENPNPRQVQLINSLIDQAWGSLQRQLQQLFLI